MFRPLSLFIGIRYIAAKRRNRLVSFISLTSMLGLALGVCVMIVVLSVMNGFDYEMRTRVLGMVPQAVLESTQPVANWEQLIAQFKQHPGVTAVAPLTQIQGLLTHQGQIQTVQLSGIEPALEARVSIIGEFFREGALDSLIPGEFKLLLGDRAAKALGVGIGDKITFVAPEATITPAGIFPRLKRFTVAGIFHSGAGEIDGHLALAHQQDIARLLRFSPGQVQSLRLAFADIFAAPNISWQLARGLSGDWFVTDWMRSHGGLYQAISVEKRMIALLLLLIVAVAAFNIVSTLVMVVADKKADIAILRTMGASSPQIMRIFIIQGSLIGVIGTLVGVLLGCLGAENLSLAVAWLERLLGIQFLDAGVYFIDYLPSRLQMADVLLISSAALILSFFATWYPAFRAARTQPAEALRHE
ncbi:cell division protein FtsX [Ventosimonas gracilis]|uniref:Cell division protein FtsX n=1 Tax=Ventosimonas gracilis TaxID=1680762 RepID=A0A139SR66_9GAMM|nr:lipoprotein-releasing ABC transporter permease subunit [Ventosimonas gracilis]KXU37048.1 cell division protein FtsX [Ventosimonas gracilis]